MNYILVIVSTLLLAMDFICSKKYQMSEGVVLHAGLKFNALQGLSTAMIFFAFTGFKVDFSWFSVLLAFLLSLCSTLYNIIGFKILSKANVAHYSIFLMSGGMLLPYIFGVLFLDEQLTVIRVCGVVLILSGVLLSNRTKQQMKSSIFLLCFIIFVLNGFVSIISKCHQINAVYPAVNSTGFVMLSGMTKCILSSIGLLFCKPNKEKLAFSSRSALFIIVLSALLNGISYTLQLIGATELPATVLYPLITGGSIVFSALLGAMLFRERITRWQLLSIVLCFIGTVLFL